MRGLFGKTDDVCTTLLVVHAARRGFSFARVLLDRRIHYLNARASGIGERLEGFRESRVSLPNLVVVLVEIALLINDDATQEVDPLLVILDFLADVGHLLENFHVIALVVHAVFILELNAGWGV